MGDNDGTATGFDNSLLFSDRNGKVAVISSLSIVSSLVLCSSVNRAFVGG